MLEQQAIAKCGGRGENENKKERGKEREREITFGAWNTIEIKNIKV